VQRAIHPGYGAAENKQERNDHQFLHMEPTAASSGGIPPSHPPRNDLAKLPRPSKENVAFRARLCQILPMAKKNPHAVALGRLGFCGGPLGQPSASIISFKPRRQAAAGPGEGQPFTQA